jgi:hypothetical protein
MVIDATGSGGLYPFMPILAQRQSGFAGGGGSFGIDWRIVGRVGAWIANTIILGLDVKDSIKRVDEQLPPEEKLAEDDVKALASELSRKFPTAGGTSKWYSMLQEGLAPRIEPTPPPCPAGFYRDPATGACLEVKKAGFAAGVPAWAWALIGAGVLLVLPRLGVLRPPV